MDAYLAEVGESLSTASRLGVGFLENATYPDGTPVAFVAATQEYGAPRVGIPPRPFFRSMIAAKSPEWGPAVAALLVKHDYDARAALTDAGFAIKGQLQQSIIDTNSPPLSPTTLMLRKMRREDPDLVVTGRTVGEAAARVAAGESTSGVSTKPLVDQAVMLNSVDFVVK